MKIKNRKKNARKALMRKGKKCPNCQKDISDGGHYIPALNEWICE